MKQQGTGWMIAQRLKDAAAGLAAPPPAPLKPRKAWPKPLKPRVLRGRFRRHDGTARVEAGTAQACAASGCGAGQRARH